MCNKPVLSSSSFLDFFSLYSDFFTAVASLAGLIALIISIIAITKSSNDGRHQILVGKLEEMFELISSLTQDYPKLYDVYILLEKSNSATNPIREHLLNSIEFEKELEKVSKSIKIENAEKKVTRLYVLAYSYLGEKPKWYKLFIPNKTINELKFNTLGYIQIYNALLLVLKHKDLMAKTDIFREILPTADSFNELTSEISQGIIKKMNFGVIGKGYRDYRDTEFKIKIGVKE